MEGELGSVLQNPSFLFFLLLLFEKTISSSVPLGGTSLLLSLA